MARLLRPACQIAHHSLSRPEVLLASVDLLATLPVTGEFTDLARLALEGYLALGAFLVSRTLR